MSNQELFSEFPPVSKEMWLLQIQKDLKDRSPEALYWHSPEGLELSPFVHAEDFSTPPSPLSDQAYSWEICEAIQVSDPVTANRQALEALEGGAEGLCFVLGQALQGDALEQLLQQIHPDFIGLHFSGPAVSENPGMVFGQLENLAPKLQLSTGLLSGSLAYDPVPVSKIVDWRYLSDLLDYSREKFPQFRIIQVNAMESTTLSDLLQLANIYLRKLSERGQDLQSIVAAMEFSVSIGKSYFLEISRLRAFKLLWFNLLKAWNLEPQEPYIAVRFRPEAYSDELYTNMIRATTMAMAAVQGGARRLTVLPYDSSRETLATYPQAFGRRIARNVQHLLKMESGLDASADPAAGSYYIETLTLKLAEKAWQEFTSYPAVSGPDFKTSFPQ